MKVAALFLAVLCATPLPTYAVETFTFHGLWGNPNTSQFSPWIGSASFDVDGDGTFEHVGWSVASNFYNNPNGSPFQLRSLTIKNGQLADMDFLGDLFRMSAGGVAYFDVEPTVGNIQGLASFDVVQTSPVPEPETWALLVAGLGAVGAMRRKSRGA